MALDKGLGKDSINTCGRVDDSTIRLKVRRKGKGGNYHHSNNRQPRHGLVNFLAAELIKKSARFSHSSHDLNYLHESHDRVSYL